MQSLPCDNLKNIEAVRRDVGMVFQSFNLFPHMRVIDNLTLAPMLVRRMTKEQAEDMALGYLERVKIAKLVAEQGLSRAEAYILCGAIVDLKISEIVDAPNWIVSAQVPCLVTRILAK